MKDNKEKLLFKFEANEYPLKPGIRLIEASAGTGKTFALAHLVLRLLTEENQPINKILVVTFTEAAAAELRGRISNRIEMALAGLEAKEKNIPKQMPDEVLQQWVDLNGHNEATRYHLASQLLEALENLDSADITTIHGFCKRTLQREALHSNASITPLLEEDPSDLALETVHDYWQHQVLTLKPKHLKGLQNASLSSEALYKTLLKVDNDPSLVFKIDNPSVNPQKPLAEQFTLWIEERWVNFVSAWEKEGIELELSLRAEAERWRNQGVKDTKPFSPKPKKNRYEIVNNWIEAFNAKNSATAILPVPYYTEVRAQTLLASYFHPAAFCQTAKRCGENHSSPIKPELQTAIAELWDGPAEQTWKHALGWSLNVLNERRRQRGVISYGGLLKALDPGPTSFKGSKNHPSSKHLLLEKLRERYQITLIDEFQDTDALQWRLLKEAFGTSPEHLLLMVGDPKQAIYRFRGGDLNIYLSVRNQADRIDQLHANYRTSPLLMQGINNLLAPGLRRSGLKVPPLTALTKRPNLHLSKNKHPLQLLTVGLMTSKEVLESESLDSKSQLEEIIPTALTNTVMKILKDNSNEVQPSDICILVSRHNQAASLRDELALAGVPSRLVSQGDILTSTAAQVLQRFLNCLAMPSDSRNLRLVACSVLMQWKVERIKVAEKNGELDELASKFRCWSKSFARLGVFGCLSELLEGRTMADISERGRMLGDLQQCAELVQEEVHRQGLDAMSAARWLRRQRLSPTDDFSEAREPRSDIEESAVNVVTIHRSKGLEYRIVICPYLWQAPPLPSGPLWCLRANESWRIALNSKWGKGRESAEEAHKASLQEAERLAYVAFTRAKEQLIIFWANGANQEGNPLIPLLFGPESIKNKIEDLSAKNLNQWLTNNKVEISLSSAQTCKIKDHWKPPLNKGRVSLGPVPQRKLDSIWGRISYSSLVASKEYDYRQQVNSFEPEDIKKSALQNTQKLIKYSSNNSTLVSEIAWPHQSPLGNFPRGAAAGDCLHRILERISFSESLKGSKNTNVIEEELFRTGLDINLRNIIQDGLSRVLSTSLGGPLGDLRLGQLSESNRIHELKFDLPIAHNGKNIRSLDLANAFLKSPNARFGSSYHEQLVALNFSCRGFLTGSIDLIFPDHEDPNQARWWLADWKSNWIGSHNEKDNVADCGPLHYNDEAMENQMVHHHYPLQAHLYLVALHRFLKWRLPNYNPINHLGGYIYIFLRGVPGDKVQDERPHTHKVPGLIIEQAPIDRIIELDRLLQEGGK